MQKGMIKIDRRRATVAIDTSAQVQGQLIKSNVSNAYANYP